MLVTLTALVIAPFSPAFALGQRQSETAGVSTASAEITLTIAVE